MAQTGAKQVDIVGLEDEGNSVITYMQNVETYIAHTFSICNFQDANGPIGLTSKIKKSQEPVRLDLSGKIVKIVSGTDHLCCLSDDGLKFTVGK